MLEYIVASAMWSVGGFAAGWFACSRFQRLERKVDRIDRSLEGKRDSDEQ